VLITRDIRLIVYGLVVSAYMAISYEVFKDLMKTPIDFNSIIASAIAGLGSLGVGIVVFFTLIYKKRLD
jgi:hypothetical protein